MGIVRKQSVLSTLFIYIGFAIGAVNTLWLLGHFVPKEIAGLSNLLNQVSLTFSIFATLGSLNALYKFYPFYRTYLPAHKNDLPFLIIVANAVGCALVIIGLLVFKNLIARKLGHNSPLFIVHYKLLLPYTITYLCLMVLEAFCWTIKKTVITNLTREVVFRAANSVVILLYVFKIISVETFLRLFSLSYLPSVLILLYVVLKDGTIKICITISQVTKKLYTKILTFISFHFTGMLIAIVPPAIDSVMIAGLSSGGLSNVWIYNIPVYLVSIMDVPFRSMAGITTMLIAEAWKNKDKKKIDELYQKTSLNLLILGLALFCILLLSMDNLGRFLGPGYELLKILFLIKGLAKLIDLGSGMNAQILILSQYWRFDFYTSAAFISVNVVLDYVLIKIFGVIGAAYGSAIALVFYNFARFFYLWKFYRLQPFSSKTLAVLAFGAIAFFAVHFIPYLKNIVLDTAVRTVIFCLLFAAPVLYFKISEDINAMLQTAVKRFRNL
jgi:O-antigen/teichoic acid export membrane protein